MCGILTVWNISTYRRIVSFLHLSVFTLVVIAVGGEWTLVCSFYICCCILFCFVPFLGFCECLCRLILKNFYLAKACMKIFFMMAQDLLWAVSPSFHFWKFDAQEKVCVMLSVFFLTISYSFSCEDKLGVFQQLNGKNCNIGTTDDRFLSPYTYITVSPI